MVAESMGELPRPSRVLDETYTVEPAQDGEPAHAGAWLFHRMLVFDSFAIYFRALIALATVVAVWMSIGSVEVRACDQGEYYAILLASTLGMFLMAEA